MFYLYYNNISKNLVLTQEKHSERGFELLEANHTLESLVARSETYIRTYKCEIINECEEHVDKRYVVKIKKKNRKKRKLTEEVRRKISKGVSGDKNGRYGVLDSQTVRRAKSEKLKFYYKYHVHGKKNYKDSEETRKQKSINNNNRGGWFWIHNRTTGEEKRCYGEIPEGFRRVRLFNPF